MTNQNPANPAPAATPGNDAKVITPPSAPVTPGSEGKVTITTKEYADLQRAKARTLSFEKRASLKRPSQPANPGSGSGESPELIAERARADEAERIALGAQVRAGVNEILGRPEFKALPASTRALILKNPGMLSDADNVDEALLDIEDFVRENVIPLDTPAASSTPPAGTPEKGADPKGHETPPAPGTAPTVPTGIELEDVTKLPPEQRSRAVLRNAIKKRNGVQ